MSPQHRLAVLLLALAGAALGARAQPASLPIAATDQYERFEPRGVASAPLAGGGFALLWSVGDSPFHLDVRLQYVGADGTLRLGSEGVPVASSIERETSAAVAYQPSGGVFAAYLATLSHSAEERIFVQAFDGEGRPRWPEEGIVPAQRTGRDVHSEPRLLADCAGGVFVCFTRDDGASGVSREIVCQHLGPNGERLWGDDGRSAGGRAGTRELPSLVTDLKGGILVFWVNRRDIFAPGAADPVLIEGQRFSADGLPLWGTAGRQIHDTALPTSLVTYPEALRAAPDGMGGAVLAFRAWSHRSNPSSPSDDLLAQRIDSAGRLRWGSGTVVADGSQDLLLKSLIPTLDGGAIAVATEATSGELVLRLYRLAGNGRPRWPRMGIPFETHAGSAFDESVRGAYEEQRLQLAWVARPGGLSDRHTELRLATFDGSGRRTGGVKALEALGEGFQELADLRLDIYHRTVLTLWNRVDYAANEGQDAVGAVTSVR